MSEVAASHQHFASYCNAEASNAGVLSFLQVADNIVAANASRIGASFDSTFVLLAFNMQLSFPAGVVNKSNC
jgi:hypothetical protein